MRQVTNPIGIYNKPGKAFHYILVGNIIDKHYQGENKEIRSGTKHFRSGAKVYLFPEYGGMGHEDIPVYGLPRKRWRKIDIVIRAVMIKNVRVKKTYDPKLIERITNNTFYINLRNDATLLKKFADALNSNHKEIIE